MLESLNQFKFVLVFLNLLILYFVLRKLLFKRVTEFMDNRTKSIKDSINDAEKQKAEAADLKRKYENQLKDAKVEGEKIIEEARVKAEKQSDSIIAAAKQESENIIARAKEEIAREQEKMLKEIRGQVAGLALAAASKVMEANMDTESNRALVDRFIDEAGAA